MAHVKRSYDTSGRRAHAERIRQELVDAAGELLLTEGYAATTVAGVAEKGQVSVESVYKRFGGKAGLVRAVVEQALRGRAPVPAETRSDALPVGDPQALLRGWGDLFVEVTPEVAPLLLVLRAAAVTDPELQALATELDETRRSRMADNARRLADAGHLRPGLTVEQARDVLWVYTAPELYDLLVVRSGWALRRFADFVVEGLRSALLAM